MSPEKYKAERKARGTQQAVADLLDVHRVTIAKRESGKIPVTLEAWLAILCLPKSKRLAPGGLIPRAGRCKASRFLQ